MVWFSLFDDTEGFLDFLFWIDVLKFYLLNQKSIIVDCLILNGFKDINDVLFMLTKCLDMGRFTSIDCLSLLLMSSSDASILNSMGLTDAAFFWASSSTRRRGFELNCYMDTYVIYVFLRYMRSNKEGSMSR